MKNTPKTLGVKHWLRFGWLLVLCMHPAGSIVIQEPFEKIIWTLPK
jgi:hypothetical protein